MPIFSMESTVVIETSKYLFYISIKQEVDINVRRSVLGTPQGSSFKNDTADVIWLRHSSCTRNMYKYCGAI